MKKLTKAQSQSRKRRLFAAFSVGMTLALSACGRSTDITGVYTADGLDTLYTFTADGKIYINDEAESYSCYRVEGNKIITYIEGTDDEMSLPFKKTDDGFMMGKLAYRRLPDYEQMTENQKTQTPDETSGEDVKTTSEEDKKKSDSATEEMKEPHEKSAEQEPA